VLVGTLGGVVVVEYGRRYPPDSLLPALEMLSFPRPEKLVFLLGVVLLLLAIDVSAWCLGDGLVRWVPLRDVRRGEVGLWKLGLGLLVLPYLVLLLAAFHLLVTPAFVALLAAPVLWRAPSLLRRRRAASPGSTTPDRARVAFALLALLLLGNAFLALFGPRPGWDALTYHLALPERFLFENRIVVTPFVWASAFPLNTEMLYTLALAVGNDVLARMIHFQFGALTLCGLFLLGRRFSARAALLAPLFMAANPLFLRELTWAYNDLVGAFYVTLAVMALGDLQRTGRTEHVMLCGLAAGACLGSRYIGGSVALALCAAVWWWRPRAVRANLVAGGSILGLAAAALLPWLIRNAVFIGNPVSPLLQSLFHAPGSEYFPPATIAQNIEFTAGIGRGRGLFALLAAPWSLTMETNPLSYKESFGFLIGPLHLVSVGAAVLVGRVRRHPFTSLLLTAAVPLFLIWFFTFQEARYLFAVFPITALLGALAFDATLPTPLWSGRPRAALAILLVPLFAAGLAQTRDLGRLGERWTLALGPLAAPPELQPDGSYRAAEVLRRELGPEGRVLLFYESRGYVFRGLDYIPFFTAEASPILQLVHEADDPGALHCRLETLGVTHVLVNHNILRNTKKFFVEGYGPGDFAADMARFRAFLDDRTRPIWSDAGVVVRALRHESGCREAASAKGAGA
jgi:hypothetical protein